MDSLYACWIHMVFSEVSIYLLKKHLKKQKPLGLQTLSLNVHLGFHIFISHY